MMDVIRSANPHLEARIDTFLARGAVWPGVTPVVATLDGEIVSCAGIFHRELWCDGAKKRFAGIGAVATRPEARGRGLATLVLEYCVQVMGDQGYGVAILFCTIADFYRRLGWKPLVEDRVEFTLPPLAVDSSYQLSPIEQKSIPAAVRDLSQQFSDAAIERSELIWQEFAVWSRDDADLFWAAWRGNELAGYVRGRRARNDPRVIELLDAVSRPGDEAALLQQQRLIVAVDNAVKFHAMFSPAHPLAATLTDSDIELNWQPTTPETSIMMFKPLRDDAAPEFLTAQDFQVGLPWQPRSWWGIDRF